MFISGEVYTVFCLRTRKTVFTFKQKQELDAINVFHKTFSNLKWSPARLKHEDPGIFLTEGSLFPKLFVRDGKCQVWSLSGQRVGGEELQFCSSPYDSDDNTSCIPLLPSGGRAGLSSTLKPQYLMQVLFWNTNPMSCFHVRKTSTLIQSQRQKERQALGSPHSGTRRCLAGGG